jgi:hypothetical protein
MAGSAHNGRTSRTMRAKRAREGPTAETRLRATRTAPSGSRPVRVCARAHTLPVTRSAATLGGWGVDAAWQRLFLTVGGFPTHSEDIDGPPSRDCPFGKRRPWIVGARLKNIKQERNSSLSGFE